jgi:hypothetical protein
MKAIPFDAFGSAQAVCANVADSAPLAAGVALPETAWHAIFKTARDVSLPTKRSATSLRMFFLNALSAFSPMMFDLPYRRTE